jgi:hypothetical protein
LAAAGFLADAVFALEGFDVFAAVFFDVAPFAAPRLLEGFSALLTTGVRSFFAVAAVAVSAFARPAFGDDRPVADLDDFLRVFLDIRLPFVAFSGVFWESQEPRSGIRSRVLRLGNSDVPEVW